MALLFVLGVTWTFGVLHILHETTLTAYLFTISNTFQGMFLFIFLCVLSRKVKLSSALFRIVSLFNLFIATLLLWYVIADSGGVLPAFQKCAMLF